MLMSRDLSKDEGSLASSKIESNEERKSIKNLNKYHQDSSRHPEKQENS